ncbi:MAG: hypothetical protein K6G58_08700 [Lachnospiraceae bacterium]|nr:hypothetical protein [Lachnospiraceae bacterium]
MKKIIKGKGNGIGSLNAPDFPYGPGGPKPGEDGKIKLPPLSAPDLPYGPGGPKPASDKLPKTKNNKVK